MTSFPIRIILLSVLLPPVLYILTLQGSETVLQERFRREIEQVHIGDTAPLFRGGMSVREAIGRNVDDYLAASDLVSFFGVRVDTLITTKEGTLLYPAPFASSAAEDAAEPSVVATENFRMLSDGLILRVGVEVGHGTVFSSMILGFYMVLSIFFLSYHYGKWSRKSRKDELEKQNKIERLLRHEEEYRKSLGDLSLIREKLVGELDYLKTHYEEELKKATSNEDEMINDIIALEERLDSNLALQNIQQEEINTLTEKLRRFEKRSESKQSVFSVAEKRFKTLYKHVELDRRAVEGYLGLTDELKIKGEEVIHQLNEDPSLVAVKRKVFGKKNRETVFEVIFSYKGRLYFGKGRDGKPVVRVVGTKNTQVKDLEYLDNL